MDQSLLHPYLWQMKKVRIKWKHDYLLCQIITLLLDTKQKKPTFIVYFW